MSKWMQTKINTLSNIENDYFEAALDRLGYYADFDQKVVTRSYEGDSKDVHCVIVSKDTGKSTNIGLRFTAKEDGTIDMNIICDWYYSNVDGNTFESKFTVAYNTVKTIDKAAQQGFTVASEEVMSDGRTKIVLTRAA